VCDFLVSNTHKWFVYSPAFLSTRLPSATIAHIKKLNSNPPVL
jgi:hypothetical protein